jgi:hypothetical protein
MPSASLARRAHGAMETIRRAPRRMPSEANMAPRARKQTGALSVLDWLVVSMLSSLAARRGAVPARTRRVRGHPSSSAAAPPAFRASSTGAPGRPPAPAAAHGSRGDAAARKSKPARTEGKGRGAQVANVQRSGPKASLGSLGLPFLHWLSPLKSGLQEWTGEAPTRGRRA